MISGLRELHSSGGCLYLVVGASGSGKSSVLRAGLISALRAGQFRGSAELPVLLFTPGAHPVDSLAAHLAEFDGTPARGIAAAIRADPRQCAVYIRPAVLIVDQFEEMFMACADFCSQALRYPQLVAAVFTPIMAVSPLVE